MDYFKMEISEKKSISIENLSIRNMLRTWRTRLQLAINIEQIYLPDVTWALRPKNAVSVEYYRILPTETI